MTPGAYQGIIAADIPAVELPDSAGIGRAIAGELLGAKRPARTFTPSIATLAPDKNCQ